MGRISPLLLIVAALIVFFVAERFELPQSHAGSQETVVSFWAFSVPAQTMLQLKTEFEEENPGIRVEVQTVPWESLQQKTLWAIAAKSNVPDVIVGSSEWTGGLVNAGALEPLDDHLEPEFFEQYFPSTLGIYQFPEVDRSKPGEHGSRQRQYGIPLDLDMMLAFYRHDLLEQPMSEAGIKSFPQTWDDFLTLARTVRTAGGTGSQSRYLLYLDPDDPVPMSMAFLPASGASFLDPTLHRAAFDRPEGIAAFRLFGRLLQEDLALRWERATMEDPMVLYKTGRTAMNIAGPWYAKYLASKAPELSGRWRVALFPRREPGLPSCGLGGACLAVPYNAPNKEAAIKLVRYMSTERFAMAYFRRVGSPPPQKTAWDDPVFQEGDPYFGGQAIYQVVKEAIETAKPLQLMPDTEVTKGPVRRAMREIAVEGRDAAEVLARAARRADEILSQN